MRAKLWDQYFFVLLYISILLSFRSCHRQERKIKNVFITAVLSVRFPSLKLYINWQLVAICILFKLSVMNL